MKEIVLTGPSARGRVAIVDDDDYDAVMAEGPWHAFQKEDGRCYARTSGATHLMHVLIMGRVGIDHVNGDGLDNRRCNLRFATPSENARNQRKLCPTALSRFKGVTLMRDARRARPWRARITIEGKQVSLGEFATEEQAARAYNRAAVEFFGRFARLNDLTEPVTRGA